MFGRKKVAMLVAELLGAAILTTVTLAVSRSNLGFPLFVAASVGFTFAVLVLMLSGISGAHINPIVTVGLWTLRKINTAQALVYVAAQMLGGLAAGRLFVYLTDQSLSNIAGSNFEWRVLVAELVGAFIFTFGVAAAVHQKYAGLRLATTVGGALFAGVVVAAVASNGLINPSVALGVQSVSRTYFAGPVIGAILGMNLYALLYVPATSVKTRKAAVASSRSAVKTTKKTGRKAKK